MAQGIIKPSAFIKVFWFATGSAVAGGAYIKLNRELWSGTKQVALNQGTLAPTPAQEPERLFGPEARAVLTSSWNRLIDDSIGRLARELGRRGI